MAVFTVSRAHLLAAGLMGAAGVALLAAGAHAAGSQSTTAGQMLLFHAPAVMAATLGRKAGSLHDMIARYAIFAMVVGVALFFHGSGFTGSGEQKLKSRASLELTTSGVTVHAGSTEIGQGTRTMLAQIVAEELGWPLSRVAVSRIDTHIVPDSGPTVASRTCLIVGGILRRCARALRLRLHGMTPKAYLAKHGSLVITEQYEKPKEIVWDDETYRGSAYAAYAFGCNVATVRIERETGIVTPLELFAVLDIGKAVNPVLARGQIEGGTLQGVGWALLEEVRLENGRMKNGQLTNYLIPTMLDSPRIEVAILEHPSKLAPFGAKGVGEAPIDGPAPAIVNAIRSLGYDIREIPATPERILEAACDSD